MHLSTFLSTMAVASTSAFALALPDHPGLRVGCGAVTTGEDGMIDQVIQGNAPGCIALPDYTNTVYLRDGCVLFSFSDDTCTTWTYIAQGPIQYDNLKGTGSKWYQAYY